MIGKKFNKSDKIAVHCKTKEEAEDFCDQMHKHGLKWSSGRDYSKYTCFNVFSSKTCYYGDGEYSGLEYAKKKKYTILEWSDYMQKEFTKADLKDGMVVEYSNGKRRLVLNNRLIGKDGYYELNQYTEDMKDKKSSERDIMRVFKIAITTTLDRIFHIETLDLIWQRTETKRMTAEEMRQELEELTGDKIEIEPSREEMIGKMKLYCSERTICPECVLSDMHRICNYWKFDSEKLKKCYEKVMEDGRKES